MKRIVVIYCMCLATVGYGSGEDSIPKHKVKFSWGIGGFSNIVVPNVNNLDGFIIRNGLGYYNQSWNYNYLSSFHMQFAGISALPHTQFKFKWEFKKWELGIATKIINGLVRKHEVDINGLVIPYRHISYNEVPFYKVNALFNYFAFYGKLNALPHITVNLNIKRNTANESVVHNSVSAFIGAVNYLGKNKKWEVSALGGIVNVNYITTSRQRVNNKISAFETFNLKKYRADEPFYNLSGEGAPFYTSSIKHLLYPGLKIELTYYIKKHKHD